MVISASGAAIHTASGARLAITLVSAVGQIIEETISRWMLDLLFMQNSVMDPSRRYRHTAYARSAFWIDLFSSFSGESGGVSGIMR